MAEMTWEDQFDRIRTIMASLPDPEDPQPPCERLAEEMGIEHENLHQQINSITKAGMMRSFTTPTDFVFLGFDLGRRWGMIEAGEASFELDLPTTDTREDNDGESQAS